MDYEFLIMQKEPISIYIHYPFCISKCPYCDFNSYVNLNIDENEFLNVYITEINYYHKLLQNRFAKTIFFGGGTPSLANSHFIEKILNEIEKLFGFDKDIEISLEANPSTADSYKFYDFSKVGINRLSIGVQSFNDNKLKFFGRTHNSEEAIKAIKIAQKYFYDKYSIDLIYATDKQKINEWLYELDNAIKLSPNHISLYQLTIENNTKFFSDGVKTASNNLASKLYETTNNFLNKKNINMYEISNYAKKGYECKHNINYWKSGEWIGIGAGAHGRICFDNNFKDKYKKRFAIENIKNPKKWLENVIKNGNGIKENNVLSKKEFIEEIIIMGLRLRDGISIFDINKYIKINNISEILNKNYLQLKELDFIEISDNMIRLKNDKFCLLDSIIEKLI